MQSQKGKLPRDPAQLPFLRIPPFPGHRAQPLACPTTGQTSDRTIASELVEQLRAARVGGSFWATQPPLPSGRRLLLVPCSRQQASEMLASARAAKMFDRCVMLSPRQGAFGRLDGMPSLAQPADPWHLAQAAEMIWAGADHELALVAALARTPVRTFGDGRFAECRDGEQQLVGAVGVELGRWRYCCPFSGDPIAPATAVQLLSDWRLLIDANRGIAGIFGVAGWKRPTVNALLWDGSAGPHHADRIPTSLPPASQVAVWKSRTPRRLLERLERSRMKVLEIEDGMIRGQGLGANCVPPLSIVVDRAGIYFDPSQSSDLELILESAHIDDVLIDRATRLRKRILEIGISKYGSGGTTDSKRSDKHQILVIGQVEDDRSILSGGAGQTNLELLARARAIEPDAWLIYRPHPDVEAGHRKGHITDEVALRFADEIERGGSITALIEMVDEVHCITSLAGFEALLRGKAVTTHGVPFYAGRGLTRDLGPVPDRRTRKRTLDELVAAALIVYPRYIDPVTRLPCSVEVLVERIAQDEAKVSAPLARVRKMQGRLKLTLRRLREAAA